MGKGQIIGFGRTAEIVVWDENRILKLFRDGWSISSVKWEETVARAVYEAGLPVPAVYGVIEKDGRHGIIYERVYGPSMLQKLISKPEELEHFAFMFAELHAQMHSLKIRKLPSHRQQLEKKICNAKVLLNVRMEAVLKALQQLPDDNVLCHGDFHPDNILMSASGPVVIDWNDATQGNPDADIARTLLLLKQGEPVQPFELDSERIQSMRNLFIKTYLRRYDQVRPISLANIELWRLPVAAARLSEDIKEEESRLLSIVEMLTNEHL
ncbi:MAG: aminoglycoside phosphotransferase family protein [Candidatus Bathyarchaeota archaeon]|jgi:uncharacterized protein (TIGR02172 family)